MVEFILVFAGDVDGIQCQEVRTFAGHPTRSHFRHGGRRIAIVHGRMRYGDLAALSFARRNSDCLISMDGLGIHDRLVWANAGLDNEADAK